MPNTRVHTFQSIESDLEKLIASKKKGLDTLDEEIRKKQDERQDLSDEIKDLEETLADLYDDNDDE